MSQRLLSRVGAFIQETVDAINDNFAELFDRPVVSPGGVNTDVQVNIGGAFSGSSAFIFDSSKGNAGSIRLGGNPDPNLVFGGATNYGLSAISDGQKVQCNFVAAKSSNAGIGFSTYAARGTIAAPADIAFGDNLFTLNVQGFNRGFYRHLAELTFNCGSDLESGVIGLRAIASDGFTVSEIVLDIVANNIQLNAATIQIAGNVDATLGDIAAASYHVGATAGIDASITTDSLVGKTITVSKGIITGFA